MVRRRATLLLDVRRACLFAGIALGAVLGPTTALAQDPAAKAAQPLFDEATAEMDRGEYTTACPKLLRVTLLAPEGIGAKETLAECYEKQGRLASAHRQYVAAEAAARQQKKPDRAREAASHAAALRPRLATLALEMADIPPGVAVRLDGAPLEGEPWKTPVFVDAGKFKLQIEAPGRAPYSTTIEVKGERAAVKIRVPALEIAPTEPVVGKGAEGPGATGAPSDTAAPAAPPSGVNGRLIGGIALAGVGAVTVALGVVSSLQVADAQKAVDPYRGQIPPGSDVCDAPTLEGLSSDAQPAVREACSKASAFEPLQIVFYAIGAAAIGTSVFLIVTSRPKTPVATVTRLSPTMGPGRGGLVLTGTF